MNFFRRRKIAKNFVPRKPSSIQTWNCTFQIPPTSCAYLPLLFLGHIITFHKTIQIHYWPQHGCVRKEKGKVIDKIGIYSITFFFIFLKRFLNGDSKEKIKQRNYFFMKRMKGFYFLLYLFNIYFYLEISLF